MTELIGEGAGLAASLFWALSSTFFSLGGRIRGHQSVNAIRLVGATLMLAISHFILLGTILPGGSLYIWLMLGLSGMVGLALGDGLLMWAHVAIGPRRAMLIMSLVPIVTTSVAWVIFAETIDFIKLIAIGITVAGVSYVVMEKKSGKSMFKVTWLGILLGVGGMLGQAIQMLIAKDAIESMRGDMISLSATYIRILWGTAAIWLVLLIRRNLGNSLRAFSDKKFMTYTLIGTSVGPFLGVWASYLAIEFAPIGIASTLMSLAPLIMIPISFFVFKEKPTWRAVIGTFVAISGVAIIFLT
jgi:drug/metabolite transporter (DMT)-like permease